MTSRNIKLAQPYAEALLELNSGSVDKVITDLNTLSTILSESADLTKALSNPLLSADTKKGIIKSVFEESVSSSIIKFLMVLCDRGRISYLDSIIGFRWSFTAISILVILVAMLQIFSAFYVKNY